MVATKQRIDQLAKRADQAGPAAAGESLDAIRARIHAAILRLATDQELRTLTGVDTTPEADQARAEILARLERIARTQGIDTTAPTPAARYADLSDDDLRRIVGE